MKKLIIKTMMPILLLMAELAVVYPLCADGNGCDYLKLWLLVGIPFGVHRMFLWIVPKGYDLGGTVGILTFNFLIGGLIGGFILIWRLIAAIFCLVEIMFLRSSRITGR